jgi:hypothetical protein
LSKGSLNKNREILINYNFRSRSIFFTAGLNYSNFSKNKMLNLIYMSNGMVSYLPTTVSTHLFFLTCYRAIGQYKNTFIKDVTVTKPFINIRNVPFLLLHQAKNANISFLELKLKQGSRYTRSLGSKSKLVKLDTRTGYALVVLPSSLKKVFSIFALASEGPANISILKKSLVSTKCGDARKLGKKSKVRGVAKNPVDHPHGGRTKAIKYQRTP